MVVKGGAVKKATSSSKTKRTTSPPPVSTPSTQVKPVAAKSALSASPAPPQPRLHVPLPHPAVGDQPTAASVTSSPVPQPHPAPSPPVPIPNVVIPMSPRRSGAITTAPSAPTASAFPSRRHTAPSTLTLSTTTATLSGALADTSGVTSSAAGSPTTCASDAASPPPPLVAATSMPFSQPGATLNHKSNNHTMNANNTNISSSTPSSQFPSRRIVVSRPRKISTSTDATASDGQSASSTSQSGLLTAADAHAQLSSPRYRRPSDTGDHTTIPAIVSRKPTSAVEGERTPSTGPSSPRGRAQGGFTVAGDMSAAQASLDRSARRSSQGSARARGSTGTAAAAAAAGGDGDEAHVGEGGPWAPTHNAASPNGGSKDREGPSTGFGARAAQFQQATSPVLPPPVGRHAGLSPHSPSTRSSGTQHSLTHRGLSSTESRREPPARFCPSPSFSSSSSSSQYNSSFSEEQEEEEDEKNETRRRDDGSERLVRPSAPTYMPRATVTTSPPMRHTTTTVAAAAPPPPLTIVTTTRTTPSSLSTSAVVNASASSLASATSSHPGRQKPVAAAHAHAQPRESTDGGGSGLAPSDTAARLPQLRARRGGAERSAGVEETSVTMRVADARVRGHMAEADVSDDEHADTDDDDFDEEDEALAVFSYMDSGARELRESLKRVTTAPKMTSSTSMTGTSGAGQHAVGSVQPSRGALSGASVVLSGRGGRQSDGDVTVLSSSSSPTLHPSPHNRRGRGSIGASPVEVTLPMHKAMTTTSVSSQSSSPRGTGPSSSPPAAAATVLPSPRHPLPSPSQVVPHGPGQESDTHSHAAPTAAAKKGTGITETRPSVNTRRAGAAAAPGSSATPASSLSASVPSSASSLPPGRCRMLSLYEAFYLDASKTQWLVDDAVLAKVLEYVRLMGYEHPLARSPQPGSGTSKYGAGTARASPSTPREASTTNTGAGGSAWSRDASDPLMWSSTGTLPSPLVFAGSPQERVPCHDGVHRRAALRQRSTAAAAYLERTRRVSSLLFLDNLEPLRWLSEQEYVIGAVLLCCAYTSAPPVSTASTASSPSSTTMGAVVSPAVPPSVHPMDHVLQLVQTQYATSSAFHTFEQLWETQARLVLGTASPSHQRVFSSPDEGVTLYSDFEGGNLWRVEKAVEPYSYHIWLEPDHGSDKRIWFRFAVAGAVEGRTMRFRLLNAATHSKLYRQHNMTPVWRDGQAQMNWTSVDQCSFRVSHGGGGGSAGYAQPGMGRSASAQQCDVFPSTPVSPAGGNHQGGGERSGGVGGIGGTTSAGSEPSLSSPPPPPPASAASAAHLEDNGEVYFTIVPRSTSAVIQVAFCVPYTYADLLCHICHWHAVVKSSVCSIRFEERVLCRTPDGRKLHLLIITSPNDATTKKAGGKGEGGDGATMGRRKLVLPATGGGSSSGGGGGGGADHAGGGGEAAGGGSAEGNTTTTGKDGKPRAGVACGIRGPYSNFSSGKKVVLISARVHPGEVTASHGCHGLISFLLSSDPRAVRLREHYLFFIVPMLNPDGVSRGHSRFDQFGNNLNRCYNAPDPTTQPTVFALRNVFQHLELSFQERFFLYIDFHSHASQSSGFMFGNHLPKSVHHWNMVFPKLVELHARDVFSFALCRFGRMQMSSKDGASRVLFGGTLIHSYTVELTYFTDGRLYADTFLAMNNRGSVVSDSAVSGPEAFQCSPAATASATTPSTTGAAAALGTPHTVHHAPPPATPSGIFGTTSSSPSSTPPLAEDGSSAVRPPAQSSTRRSRTPAGVAAGSAASSQPPSQPPSSSHRKRSVGASKTRSRSSLASTTANNAARRRARSEGVSSPRHSRRSLAAELIPGSRPGKDVPAPLNTASTSATTTTTTTTTRPAAPRYLHGIAMPSILCQSALIGQSCLLALLDYGVVGGPRVLSGELTAYGGMDHVLTEVKRSMMKKTTKKKRPGATPPT